MTRRGRALAVLILLAFAVPARAAEPRPEDVMAAFEQLLGEPSDRSVLGLPSGHTWRLSNELTIYIFDVWGGAEALQTLTRRLSNVTGVRISVTDLSSVKGGSYVLLPWHVNMIVTHVFPRSQAAAAGKEGGVDPDMLMRFEKGRTSLMFRVERESGLHLVLWVAAEEPLQTLETSHVLALVWALGGTTMGKGLERLISSTAGAPTLTPLGATVFALLYHPDMAAGLPLDEARVRAGRILGLEQ